MRMLIPVEHTGRAYPQLWKGGECGHTHTRAPASALTQLLATPEEGRRRGGVDVPRS